jgi:hypothetical protein
VRPQPGDLLQIDDRASVQFRYPFLYRVIRPLDLTTYDGWIWLDGYQLDGNEVARLRRSIFVQLAGIVYVHRPHRPRRPTSRTANAHRGRWAPAPRTYIDVDPDPD